MHLCTGITQHTAFKENNVVDWGYVESHRHDRHCITYCGNERHIHSAAVVLRSVLLPETLLLPPPPAISLPPPPPPGLSFCLSVSVCLSVCLSVSLSLSSPPLSLYCQTCLSYLSIYISIDRSLCLRGQENKEGQRYRLARTYRRQ